MRRTPSRVARRIIPICSAPSSPSGRCAGPTGRACACASTACSKRGCNRSTASCSADWSKACGRRRRAAIPGSAARCAAASGSTCRSGAFRSLRTTSRRCSAPARSCWPIPPSSPARRRCRRASSSGWRRSPASSDGTQRCERGEQYLAWARELDRPEARPAAGAAARAEARARRTADLAVGHRDRDLAARSLLDLCAAHSAAAAARRRSTRRPARATAAP